MFFLTAFVFVILFYVFPLHRLVYATAADWAITPPALRRIYELTGLNLPFWASMVIAFALLYLLGWLAARFLETQDFRTEIAAVVNPLAKLRGLGRVQGLGLVLVPGVLGLGLVFGAISQPVLLLGLLTFAAFLINLVGRLPLPLPSPVTTVPLVGVTTEAPSRPVVSEGNIRKRYTWRFVPHPYLPAVSSIEFSIELDISEQRYQDCRNEPRETDRLAWDSYVTASLPEVQALASQMAQLHLRRDYCTFNQAANVLAFAQQCIKYASDLSPEGEAMEYPKYPIESLVEEAGDCEDHAILAAALLKRMGLDVALVFCPGHAALGVAGAEGLPGTYLEDAETGIRYFYGETSADGWQLGELPQELKKHLAAGEFQILPVVMTIEPPS